MNTTVLAGVNSLQGLAYYTNNQVEGLLFTGGLVALYIIALMVLLRGDEPFLNILSIVSWAFFVLSLFFWVAVLVPVSVPICFLCLSIVGTAFLYFGKPTY